MKFEPAAASFAAAALLVVGQSTARGAEPALEEVVVTAGFRDMPVMTDPRSVSVVAAETIESRGAIHLESVLNTAPNVTYSSGASRARFVQMRGVGDLEQFIDPKHYPSVGIAVDDIDLGGTANAAMLFDAEQVEILRGPQGTRFGTSALAGLVNVRGRRPGDELEGYVTAGVADYGTYLLGAAVGGPLGERTAGRIAASKHESDGYVRNAFLGRDDTNGYDETSLRASLDVDPSDRASLSFTGLFFESRNGYDAFSLDNTRATLSDQPGRDEQRSAGIAARGEWQVGESSSFEAVLTSLDSDLEYAFDEDWTYVGICDGTLCDPVFDFFSNTDEYVRERDETSVDLRWLGERGGATPLRYVVGAYVQQRDEDLAREYYGPFTSRYETDRVALYAELEVDLGDRFAITAGLRREQFDDAYADSFGSASTSDDALTSGELTAAFDATPSTLVYATLARGNKPGGVNTEASANVPFMQPQFQAFLADRLRVERETLTNLEVGIKGSYVDDRLAFRAAAFRMERDDAQLESWVWDGVSFLWIGFLDNVEGSNTGLEAELDFDATAQWRVFASVGLLDAQVDAITTFDLDLGDFVERRDVDQAKAPDWQVSLGAEWSGPGPWSARIEAEGRDDSRYGYYHDGALDGFGLLNASLAYSFDATEVRLWGRNLGDEDYAVHGLYFGNDPRKGWINENYFQLGEPRLVGLSVRHSF